MIKFLQISIGISAILLSGALFVKSIQPSYAESVPPKQLTNTTIAAGKYMMNQFAVYSVSENTIYQYVLVWDTETGKSKMYWFDRTNKKNFEWEAFGKDLPATPL